MDNHSLIPPSHFEPDSLNTSPQTQGNSQLISSQTSSKSAQAGLNSVLKTPNDFTIPQHKKIGPSNANQKPKLSSKVLKRSSCNRIPSRDSGYDWDLSKGDTSSVELCRGNDEDDVKLLLKKLKEENCSLKLRLKCNKTGKENSSATMDVITHQVQYIERLQQDIAAMSNKLSNREDELSKQELLLHQKDLRLQQQSFEINKLKEETEHEAKEKLCLSDVVVNLKNQLQSSFEEKEQTKKMHNNKLLDITEKHNEELQNAHDNSRKMIEEMQKHFEQERSAWENQNAESLKKYEEKCQVMSAEYKAALNKAIDQVEEENNKIKGEKQIAENELQQRMANEQSLCEEINVLKEKEQDFETNLKRQQDEMELQAQQIRDEKEAVVKLRTYITQIQTEEHARDQWKNEKEEFNERFLTMQEEKDELVKTLEILNIRFQSVSKILEMQEESISAHTKAISDVRSQNKPAVVTSQWRMKVFELMVQCKTQQLMSLEESSKHKLVVKDFSSRLEDQTRESDILSIRLKDVEAQLELKCHIHAALEKNNEKLKQELKSWKLKHEEEKSSLSQLRSDVTSMHESFVKAYEENTTGCIEKCLRLEQRLAFANNRLRTVQDLIKRRDTKWRVRLQQKPQTQNIPIVEPKKENLNLDVEIVQLMEERDSLSHQLARDAADFEQTITKMKRNEENYRQSSQEMEKQVISYEEKIHELSAKLDNLEVSLEDEKYENENIKTELLKLKKETKQAADNAVEDVKLRHLEALQEKEAVLNQTKRELTKCVVALRQAERASVRKTNYTSEQLETERKLWLAEEEKMRNDLRQLQKDNNLLMTTLRQEGLLSTFKSVRRSPIKLSHVVSKEEPVKKVHFKNLEEGSCEDVETKTEDVDKILQDLTSLSEKVLADTDSD